MQTWYECKVNYLKIDQGGFERKVTDNYLVDAVSFTDAESRITAIMKELTRGDFKIKNIKPSNITDIINNKEGEWWFQPTTLMMPQNNFTLDLNTCLFLGNQKASHCRQLLMFSRIFLFKQFFRNRKITKIKLPTMELWTQNLKTTKINPEWHSPMFETWAGANKKHNK